MFVALKDDLCSTEGVVLGLEAAWCPIQMLNPRGVLEGS